MLKKVCLWSFVGVMLYGLSACNDKEGDVTPKKEDEGESGFVSKPESGTFGMNRTTADGVATLYVLAEVDTNVKAVEQDTIYEKLAKKVKNEDGTFSYKAELDDKDVDAINKKIEEMEKEGKICSNVSVKMTCCSEESGETLEETEALPLDLAKLKPCPEPDPKQDTTSTLDDKKLKLSFEVLDLGKKSFEKGKDGKYNIPMGVEVTITATATGVDGKAVSSKTTWEWKENGNVLPGVDENTYTMTSDVDAGEYTYVVTCKAEGYVDVTDTIIMLVAISDNSPVGTIGMLDGREAIVVELNNTKLAIATMNVGATSVRGNGCYGDYFTFQEANDPSRNTELMNEWYVPTKEQLDSICEKLVWVGKNDEIGEKAGAVWNVTATASLFLPASDNTYSPGVAGYYWSSTNSSDNTEIWYLGFEYMDPNFGSYTQNDQGAADGDWGASVRLFHDLK